MTTVDRRLRIKCTKLACRKVGVMNLHTCPLFLIFLASFQPSTSRDLGLGAKNSVFTILYTQSEIMNIMMSTNMMKTVNVQHLTVGQRLIIMAWKKVSSLALFSLFYRGSSLLLKMPEIKPLFSSSAFPPPMPSCYLRSSASFCSSSLLLRSLSRPKSAKLSLSTGIILWLFK